MLRICITIIWMLSCLAVSAQDWEYIKTDNSYIWGEGWGSSVDEADQQALSSLVSKITIAVVSDFRQVEEQVLSSNGDEHYLMRSNRSSAYSNVTQNITKRVIQSISNFPQIFIITY